MSRKKIAWFLLMTFLLEFISPIISTFSSIAQADEELAQTIIDQTDLQVTSMVHSDGANLQWQIHYEKSQAQDQILKFKLIVDETEIKFNDSENFSYDNDHWFVENTFSKTAQDTLTFTTDQAVTKVTLAVQADEQVEAENETSVTQNVLPSALQGPYELKIPEITTAQTQVESSSANEEPTQASVDKTTESSSASVEKNEADDNSIERTIINDAETKAAFTLFSNMGTQAISYQDPFSYDNIAIYGGSGPVNGTNQYLDGTNQENTTWNFDYGKKYSGTPSTTKISGGSNFYNGYHQNQNADGTATILTKKTVSPTSDPNRFQVQVDTIGGAKEVKQPIDVVFVVDKSKSMVDNKINGKTRWQVLQAAMKTFSSGLLENADDVHMGLVSFGSNGTKSIWAEAAKFGNSYFTNDATTLNNNTIMQAPIGTSYTPTFMGVELGTKILTEKARKNAKKYLIVLTDGVATFYPKNQAGITEADKATTGNKETYTLYSGNFSGDGWLTHENNVEDSYWGNHDYITGRVYSERLHPGVDSVTKLSMGFSIDRWHDTAEPTLAFIGPDGASEANDEESLREVLSDIEGQIRGYNDFFSNGTLVDPMSEYVDLKSEVSYSALSLNSATKELTVTPQTSSNFPDYAQTIIDNAQVTDNRIKLSDMYLGASNYDNQGIRYTYTVELKEKYRNGTFYPANGPTYAYATNFDSQVAYAVPSVRVPTFDLTVKKNWDDVEDKWNLRDAVNFELQKKVDGNWQSVEKVAVTETEAWQHTFTGLIKKDFSGAMIVYRVVETDKDGKQRVYGYEDPTYSATTITGDTTDSTITVTNKLVTTNIEFLKYTATNDHPLKGAGFRLYKNTNDVPIGDEVFSGTDGMVHFENIPVGDYVLKETTVPTGFTKAPDISVAVTQNESGELEYRFDKSSVHEVKNDLKDFKLVVEKVDPQGKPVSGVKFQLKSDNVTTEPASVSADEEDGNIFTFLGLQLGTYTLTETEAPDKYVKIKPLKIVIDQEGKVTIDGELQENVLTEVGDNLISLTVTNKEKGLLPATGGPGTHRFLLTGIVIFGLLLIVVGYYSYRNRKGTDQEKHKSLFVPLLLLFTVLIGLPQPIFAAEDTVDLVIHKQTWQEPPDKAQPVSTNVAGAGFTVYDVTDRYYALLADADQETVLQKIQAKANEYEDKPVTEETFTDTKGLARFTGISTKKGTKDAVYLVVQTTLPDEKNKGTRVTPLVIVLPIYSLDEAGNTTEDPLSEIHLYPKNIATPIVEPPEPKPPEVIPRLRLPQTGEAKSLLALLGFLLISIAFVLWKKIRDRKRWINHRRN